MIKHVTDFPGFELDILGWFVTDLLLGSRGFWHCSIRAAICRPLKDAV
jgi:hypothetical protein